MKDWVRERGLSKPIPSRYTSLAAAVIGVLIVAAFFPPLFFAAALAIWLLGEYAFVRLSPEPLEPQKEEKKLGDLAASYDPRDKCYHFFWRAEPLYTALGREAMPLVHHLLNALSLRGNEAFTYIHTYSKYIRFTVCHADEDTALRRALEVEEGLKTLFVLKRVEEPPLCSIKPPPRRPLYAVAAVLATAALLSVAVVRMAPWPQWSAALFALPAAVALWARWRWFERAYCVSPLPFEAASVEFTGIQQPPEELDVKALPEASSFSRALRHWAVVVRKMPEEYVHRKFKKYFESIRQKGDVSIKLRRYAAALERVQRGESFLFLRVFAEAEHYGTTTRLGKDPASTTTFWRLDEWHEALSGDLTRFPIFYGGSHLESGKRYVTLGEEHITRREVTIDIDSLPAPHLLIFGGSGMGKSKTMAWLLKQFRDKGIKIAVVDPHGDYRCTAEEFGLVDLPKNALPPLDEASYAKIAAEFGMSAGEALEKLGFEVLDSVPEQYRISLLGLDPIRQSFSVTAWLLYELNRVKDEHRERLERVVVVDEAYLARGPVLEMLEFMARGARKFGLAVFLITQMPGDIPEALRNMASLMLVFGGNWTYLNHVRQVLQLTADDMAWLMTGRAPRETGGVVRALAVIAPGSVKKKLEIQLPSDVFECA